jgi:hypothetical protein
MAMVGAIIIGAFIQGIDVYPENKTLHIFACIGVSNKKIVF